MDSSDEAVMKKRIKKTKLMKSTGENFIRLDMKRKWGEKYRG